MSSAYPAVSSPSTGTAWRTRCRGAIIYNIKKFISIVAKIYICQGRLDSVRFTKLEFQIKNERCVKKILKWYESNKRDYLFWRKTTNPYHILASEMMLQKTTAKQVQNLIQKFIDRFPTTKDLANADVKEIEKLITPLGMEHRRALRFKKLAGIVMEKYDGRIPSSEEGLYSLPGVGPYITNSVLCLAFDREVPLLDTNMVRILERVFGIKSEKARARTDKKLWNFVKKITPPGKSRNVNLALLDLGALVCTAKNPKCPTCPVRKFCSSYLKGRV